VIVPLAITLVVGGGIVALGMFGGSDEQQTDATEIASETTATMASEASEATTIAEETQTTASKDDVVTDFTEYLTENADGTTSSIGIPEDEEQDGSVEIKDVYVSHDEAKKKKEEAGSDDGDKKKTTSTSSQDDKVSSQIVDLDDSSTALYIGGREYRLLRPLSEFSDIFTVDDEKTMIIDELESDETRDVTVRFRNSESTKAILTIKNISDEDTELENCCVMGIAVDGVSDLCLGDVISPSVDAGTVLEAYGEPEYSDVTDDKGIYSFVLTISESYSLLVDLSFDSEGKLYKISYVYDF
jgi:hypothetical protein